MSEKTPIQAEGRSTNQTIVLKEEPSPTIINNSSISSSASESGDAGADFQNRDATADEIKDLPHVVDHIPITAWIVIFAGSLERFAYFGVIAPWQNYMQNPRGNHAVPGALGLGQATANNIYNAFFFFSFLTPMFFAIISDLWLGRFKTLVLGMILYVCGGIVITTTSLPKALDQGAGLPGLIISMMFVGLGVGAVKAAYFPFLGDQYVQKAPQLIRRKNGQLAVADGTRTIQFMYNAYYWFTNIASLSSIPVTFLEKKYDFWIAYLLTAGALFLALLAFLAWQVKLARVVPQGTNLPKAIKALLLASKSQFKLDHVKPTYQLEQHNRVVSWNDRFVEELRRGLLACRVILCFVLFYLGILQMYNNLVSQAGQMNLHGVPNDMIQALSGVACIIFGPIIQALYEFLAKRKIAFGPIARITAAFVFCAAGMAYAAGLQKLIYSSGPCYERPFACNASNDGKIPNDVNVWAQVPVYFLIAIAEIFGFVTASEYAYSKAPKDMKTVVQALTQLTACVASLLGMALSPVAKDPNMIIFYACLAGSLALCGILFWIKFHKYDDIDDELNAMALEEETRQRTIEEQT